MLYEEARVYLDGISKYGSVLGLDSIKKLLDELGNPQNDLRFIHIAGTNGKGSILAYISSVLTEAGYKVGRYISPTVMEYLERFQIDGKYIDKQIFAGIVEQVKAAAERMIAKGDSSPTVFEMETAIAFLYFKEQICDYVVLESGLGGKLDATNVITDTLLSVFASISMDHIGVLGNTLEEIAEDKSGIIKRDSGVVSANQEPCVMRVLMKKAESMGSTVIFVKTDQIQSMSANLSGQTFSYGDFQDIDISLVGRHQAENAVVALEAVKVLRERGVKIEDKAVREGLRKAKWPGRFTVLNHLPTVIVDGAHNADAAKRLAENIEDLLSGRRIVGIAGIFGDKEYRKIAKYIAPYLAGIVLVDLPNRERTLQKEELEKVFRDLKVKSETAESISEALELAKKSAGSEGVVLAFGSLSYLGEVIRLEEKEGQQDGR